MVFLEIPNLPFGNLTQLWKITILIGNSFINDPFSIAFCMLTGGYFPMDFPIKTPSNPWDFPATRSVFGTCVGFEERGLPRYVSIHNDHNVFFFPNRNCRFFSESHDRTEHV